ncbi:uncharacterized protein Obp49a [Drosophila tropicalis]|uniref:uncharacterized protein Obp49a n=1 Tax=Drosophila tropicalis TaxID=46794 RepID=UPI0035ABB0CE
MLTKSQLFLFVALALVYVSSTGAADVDCSKRPPFMNPRTCCPVPDFLTADLKEKCKEFDTTPSPASVEASGEGGRGRRHHPHHPPPCLFSCVFNETGIYVDQKLNSAKLDAYLKVVFKDSTELQELTTEAFNNCTTKMAEFKSKMGDRQPPPPPPGMPMCPMDSGFLMGCVFKKTLKNCPASIWNNTDDCNNMREFFNNCKPPHRGPGGPPSAEDM